MSALAWESKPGDRLGAAGNEPLTKLIRSFTALSPQEPPSPVRPRSPYGSPISPRHRFLRPDSRRTDWGRLLFPDSKRGTTRRLRNPPLGGRSDPKCGGVTRATVTIRRSLSFGVLPHSIDPSCRLGIFTNDRVMCQNVCRMLTGPPAG